jgi:hypothetical protein
VVPSLTIGNQTFLSGSRKIVSIDHQPAFQSILMVEHQRIAQVELVVEKRFDSDQNVPSAAI